MEGGIVCRTEEDDGDSVSGTSVEVEGGSVCSIGDSVGTSVVSKFVFSSSMKCPTSTFILMQGSWLSLISSVLYHGSSDSDSSRSSSIPSSFGKAAVSTSTRPVQVQQDKYKASDQVCN